MANTISNKARDLILGGEADLISATIKMMICSSTYTPSASHDYIDDATNEVSGTGYTAGGITLSGVTVTYSGATATFDASDISVNPITFTNGRYGIVYISTGTPSTSAILVTLDFGADKSPSAEPLAINFSASGILTLS